MAKRSQKSIENDFEYQAIINRILYMRRDLRDRIYRKYKEDHYQSYKEYRDYLETYEIKINLTGYSKKNIKRYYELAKVTYQNFLISDLLFDKSKEYSYFFRNNQNVKHDFLSYSFSDLRSALLLFIWFKLNGRYLYVDFIINNKSQGQQLVNTLHHAVLSSKDFFYLNPQSVLNITDYSVRTWCAWEIGVFLGKTQSTNKINVMFNNICHPKANVFTTSMMTCMKMRGIKSI